MIQVFSGVNVKCNCSFDLYFSLPGSEEELPWLMIARMKDTLTSWTRRLDAFRAAHSAADWPLLEGGISRRPARKDVSSSG